MEGEVSVRDVMTREYVGVSESDTVLGAVRLMREEGVGSVVVLHGSEPVGIVTESDVLELVADEGDPAETEVSAVMSKPVVSIDADRNLSDAAGTMSRQDIRRVLVTNGGDLAGVLDERDVIAASASLSGVPSVQGTSLQTDQHASVGEGTGPDQVDAQSVEAGTAGGEFGAGDDYAAGPGVADESEYVDRSICEACGTLSRELSNVNGQLICTDCREV